MTLVHATSLDCIMHGRPAGGFTYTDKAGRTICRLERFHPGAAGPADPVDVPILDADGNPLAGISDVDFTDGMIELPDWVAADWCAHDPCFTMEPPNHG